MTRFSLMAAAAAFVLLQPAMALDQLPAPVEPAPAAPAQPSLDALAVDAIRACMSIAEGRDPESAAAIFGLKPVEGVLTLETDRGKAELLPPTAERKSCRVQVHALTLDNKALIDAVQDFLTTPPQAFAPLQSRVSERLGNYASRTSIWAASDGAALGMVTLYEVLGNEYYIGPKIIIDYIVNRR